LAVGLISIAQQQLEDGVTGESLVKAFTSEIINNRWKLRHLYHSLAIDQYFVRDPEHISSFLREDAELVVFINVIRRTTEIVANRSISAAAPNFKNVGG
jgi:hypothetical protein